jgi:hypothetical protein
MSHGLAGPQTLLFLGGLEDRLIKCNTWPATYQWRRVADLVQPCCEVPDVHALVTKVESHVSGNGTALGKPLMQVLIELAEAGAGAGLVNQA